MSTLDSTIIWGGGPSHEILDTPLKYTKDFSFPMFFFGFAIILMLLMKKLYSSETHFVLGYSKRDALRITFKNGEVHFSNKDGIFSFNHSLLRHHRWA